MADKAKKLDEVLEGLDNALERLQSVGQGRVFVVGTKITYRGRFGVVSELNKTPKDPMGSTVNLRMDDGAVVENIKVTSAALKLLRP